MKIVAYVPDLMDRSRFPKAANVTFVQDANGLLHSSAGADVVVADLNREGAFEALRNVVGVEKRIGFTNHDNSDLLESAAAAGIDAMARSRFFRNIEQLTLGG